MTLTGPDTDDPLQDFDDILSVVKDLDEIDTDEDGPAIVMQCHNGKGRTTTAMAIAGLILCHKRGFPYGTKPGEQERVSLPNASYTKGNYRVCLLTVSGLIQFELRHLRQTKPTICTSCVYGMVKVYLITLHT